MIPEFSGILSRNGELDDCRITRADYMHKYCGIRHHLMIDNKQWGDRRDRELEIIRALFEIIEEDVAGIEYRLQTDPLKFQLLQDTFREFAERGLHQRDIYSFAEHRMSSVVDNLRKTPAQESA